MFEQFFKKATGGKPYPYQREFATADPLPHLLHVPTGAGKTATAILGWLYRWQTQPAATPRRLVYCLPMRVLVEQTEREAKKWIANLGIDVPVHVLMGGVDTEKWFLEPEKPAILIGTQDMLLSRALNRGYAASRFHWPIDFGLLNNDCLWVFDEPQLMAAGVSTSAQLAGLRQSLGVTGDCPSIWMSATLEPSWLDTIDFVGKFSEEPLQLTDKDYDPKLPLHKRMTAAKTLDSLDVESSKDMKDVAEVILEKHQQDTQTLVVVNTVERAKATYSELVKLRKKSNTPTLLLIHSRFRPVERTQLNEELQKTAPGDRIVIATQVVEAGVDISSRTLVTELAPWASIVQRIGRCNRAGDDGAKNDPAQVFWIELDEKLYPPYMQADLDFARKQLKKLNGEGVSPAELDRFKAKEKITLPFEHKHVLRRRDLLDLFDTMPDLSGNDIDIQRFVRGNDKETDLQVFWRAIQDDDPNRGEPEPAPVRSELCSVGIGAIKSFLREVKQRGFLWDHIDERWNPIRDPERELRPGLTVLLPATIGAYSTLLGWDPKSKDVVEPVPFQRGVPEEGIGSDPNSSIPVALTIAQHTSNVCKELDLLLKQLGIVDESAEQLKRAAWWHDVGKAHKAFQIGMHSANPSLSHDKIWAKSGTRKRLRHGRKHFRHELASSLAALEQDVPFEVAYLVAAHHGRVRLAIRALPGEPDERDLPQGDTMFALGVYHGDTLPELQLGNETSPTVTLDLSLMRLGGDVSWTARALKLLGELGPFKLAYLEALLRAADLRTSKKEATNG